jgi:alpha/beta superfamily hydrolase
MQFPLQDDCVVVEDMRFRSDGHQLHGKLAYTEDKAPLAAVLLVGPHPLLGGTMANNVVRGLGDSLARRGAVTLRFDYRGTGASHGTSGLAIEQLADFWQRSRLDEELDYRRDVTAAAAILRRSTGEKLPLTLVGYSFGCSLLADIPDVEVASLVLVAPTVGRHAYGSFASVTAPKLVIAPEGDFAADAIQLREWFGRLRSPKRLVAPRGDGHFFRGHEEWLAEAVSRFIADSREAGR